MADHSADGVVVSSAGGVYEVRRQDGDVVTASLRGRLKQQQRTGDRVVAGDRVTLQRHDDDSHTIEAVHERRNQLARRAPGHGARRAKVIAANIDSVIAVFAAARPEPRLRMLDRFLVLAEANDIPAVIVVNKVDLIDDRAALESRIAPYVHAGYPVMYTSTVTGEGIDALRGRLHDRQSVLTGPSGAGKSSLLNAVQPGLRLRVGEVSEAVNKGRHTTVNARLLPLDAGGHVVDTPGLRELGLWNIEPDELAYCFPEFRPFLEACRFGNSCTHTHEPDCGVREAVARDEIHRDRYDSYVSMRED